MDDQAAEIAALQRKVRELEAKIEELEEDLESERNYKNRVCGCGGGCGVGRASLLHTFHN